MKMHELYEQLLEEAVMADKERVYAHAFWMAELITNLKRDPAYKKLNPSNRDQIEQIVTAIE